MVKENAQKLIFEIFSMHVRPTDSRSNMHAENVKCQSDQRSLKRHVCAFITFRVSRSRGEMYSGHDRQCVCLFSLARRIPTLLHGPGCNLGNGRKYLSST